MKKFFVSMVSLVTTVVMISFVSMTVQIITNWGVWRDTGRQIEVDAETGKPSVKYYDEQLRGTDTENFTMAKYLQYIEGRDMPKMFLTQWLLGYFGLHKHWCMYPAISAANAVGWWIVFLVLTVIFGIVNFIMQKLCLRDDDGESYRPAINMALTVYFAVIVIFMQALPDAPSKALLWSIVLILVLEVVRFILHRMYVFGKVDDDAGSRRTARRTTDGGRQQRPEKRAWWRRLIGFFRR